MDENESLYTLALKLTPGIGDVLAKQLISYCGSAAAIFKENKAALLKIPNIGPKTVSSIKASQYLKEAESSILFCDKNSIAIISYYHSDYPERLKLVNDSPLLIYSKGHTAFQGQKAIGIVGTRNATNYGKQMTEDIVKDLAAHRPVIVSGLAYGIDITAHRAAIQHGIPTIAVLAGGLDAIYPAAHQKTANEMLDLGGWISEQAPGTQPEAHYFPARNRIIAGMSEALVVVEAASKGGALITANIAYSYNREVFAVPGTLAHKYSEGCNALIRSQKANIYTSAKDIEYLLGWEKDQKKANENKIMDPHRYGEQEKKIILMLDEFREGLHLDELSWKTQISVNEVVSHLLTLEFDGWIKSLPGKRYVRI